MADDPDFLMAKQMQDEWNREDGSNSDSDVEEISFKPPPSKMMVPVKRSNPRSNLDEEFLNRTQNLVHPQWETLDPTPEISTLFNTFDSKFFQSRLKCVTLEWSKRMYSCAGICYSRRNRYGMDVTIRLSEPLLKLRPRKDLVETMLHEMIHAYCFVLNIREGNGGHGPNFKKIMFAINKVAGTNITVYHTFHDEVEVYRQHWWRCNGICTNRSPFFGYVKRTNNRAPGPNDQWWQAHQESCGGTFMKIKEPDQKNKEKSNKGKNKENKKSESGNNLYKYFNPTKTETKIITKPSDNITKNTNTNRGSKEATGFTIISNVMNNLNTSIATAFPPTSYPGLSSNPFNSNSNIGGLSGTNKIGRINSSLKTTPKHEMVGRGYTLDSGSPVKSPTNDIGQVDRNYLRQVWANRFNGGDKKSTKQTQIINDENDAINHKDNLPACSNKRIADPIDDTPPTTGNVGKRRRIAVDIKKENQDWIVLDDEIMVKEELNEVIEISEDSDSDNETLPEQKTYKHLTGEERTVAIKQEIMNESTDLASDDIILIDDEYNDADDAATMLIAGELADTSIIDEFFGEDTLLQEFKNENDVVPSFSRNIPNPENDIITCPICQGKMKRCVFGEHLDGCTGIVIKVKPPTILKKPASTKQVVKDRNAQKRHRKSTKKILLDAGYDNEVIDNLNITNSNDENDDELSLTISPESNESNVSINFSTPNENTRLYRQRGLYTTTTHCPACGLEVERNEILDHLDMCPENS